MAVTRDCRDLRLIRALERRTRERFTAALPHHGVGKSQCGLAKNSYQGIGKALAEAGLDKPA